MRTHLTIVAVIVATLAIAGVTSSGTVAPGPDPVAAPATTGAPPSATTAPPTTAAPATTGAPPTTAASPVAAPPDAVLVTDRRELVTIQGGEASQPWPGIVGLSGRTTVWTKGNFVVRSDIRGTPGAVPVDGPVGDRIAAGELVPLVTDRNEEWVAFGPQPTRAAKFTIAPGRETTEIVIVSPSGEVVGDVFSGNLLPEAFSLALHEGGAPRLYVLEYLPPAAPTHYRVRLLDPSTGDLSFPVNLRRYTATVDTQMAGISRDQVVATDRGFAPSGGRDPAGAAASRRH